MKTLNKSTYDYLMKMVNEGDNIRYIIAFCEGCGIDIYNYQPPVSYINKKLCITYRRNTYYYQY